MKRKTKQLELRGTVHRCLKCKRELKKPKSIKVGYGDSCYEKRQRELTALGELAAFWQA